MQHTSRATASRTGATWQSEGFLRVPNPTSPGFEANNLYVTLQYLRTIQEIHRYHWGLYATAGSPPPGGTLFHATDANRAALDLYYEEKEVGNAEKSISMVVCLKIAPCAPHDRISACVRSLPLMDRSKLPPNEPVWTCRVWVKEALCKLSTAGYIKLPGHIDTIENCCWRAANEYWPYRIGNKQKDKVKELEKDPPVLAIPMVFNNHEWMMEKVGKYGLPLDAAAPPPPPVIEVYELEAPPRYYGPKPMVIDSTATPNMTPTNPMDIDMQTAAFYGGPKPMVIDS